MQAFTITGDRANKRIDSVLRETYPNMPQGAMHKAFRKKDIKVNGIRVKDDYIVMPGDRLEVYIIDDILEGAPREKDFKLNQGFSVVYEDRNILIVNKQQGIPVHPDREQSANTLIDLVQDYLAVKGEYSPDVPGSFPPSLCHRLDRNTGGLVIIAKTETSLRTMLELIKNKEIKKYYQCLVKGKMEKSYQELRAYLEKDERKSRVFIRQEKTRDSLEIITRYRVLSFDNDISRLEVELVTGRTHQIRAHLAFIGHPIIGDGKYGTNEINRKYSSRYQALWACKLDFKFRNEGVLGYLAGRTFQVEPEFRMS